MYEGDPVKGIQNKIFNIRGRKGILDSDLAALYGVETKRLNEQVRRNLERFPEDFMFRLAKDEMKLLNPKHSQQAESNANLRSQIATSSYGGSRYLPFVFTEHGAIMAASVLNSGIAVQTSIFVVRAFVQMRESISVLKNLSSKLDELEKKVSSHDASISVIVEAIKRLIESDKETRTRKIGFKHE